MAGLCCLLDKILVLWGNPPAFFEAGGDAALRAINDFLKIKSHPLC
jgi:hypothetical protein